MKQNILLSIKAPNACHYLTICKVYQTASELRVIAEIGYKSGLVNRNDLTGPVTVSTAMDLDVSEILPVKNYIMTLNDSFYHAEWEDRQSESCRNNQTFISEEDPTPIPTSAICLYDIDTQPISTLGAGMFRMPGRFSRKCDSWREQDQDQLAYAVRWVR